MKKLNKTIKKIGLCSLFLLITMSMSFPANATPFAGGDGTAGNPYQISTIEQLQNLSSDLAANYKLINDIDASGTINWNSGAGFEPIGNALNKFAGTFNGQGYEIKGLYINRPIEDFVGLFGFTLSSSKINNVGLVDVNMTGVYKVGGLVGYSSGTITQSYSTGNVNGEGFTGGLVGYSSGTINQSYAASNVNGDDLTGGLVGYSSGTIIQSYSTGNVVGEGLTGGLVGHSSKNSTITQSYATGKVTGEDSVGGLVGYLDGTNLNLSYANVNVVGQNNVGGLVGRSYCGAITQSYATGKVIGEDRVGGLVGQSLDGTITQSYSAGKVTGTSYGVGGLVGIFDCGTITGSYWDLETSGQSSSAGDNGATGKTTDKMKTQSTYSGWDFTSVWNICNDATSSQNGGYPYLLNNPVEANTAPNVAIIAPEPSANISGMFFVNASVTDKNEDVFVSNVSLNNITGKVDDHGYYNLPQDSLSVGFDSSLFADGIYNITWEACENESVSLLYTSDVIEITIDNTAPFITFNDDTTVAGNYGRDWVLGNISFSDNLINSSAIYLYDESGLVTSSISGVSPHSFNFTGLADGSYQMNGSVWDLAGNVNNTGTRAILLDTTDPEITFDASTLEEGNHSQDWIFGNVSASDNLGIANITFYLYNSTGLFNSASYSGNSLSVNFTSLPTGMYYLNASAEDFAGNIVMTDTKMYGIDAIDMEITNVVVESLSDESATITWDTNENANSIVYYGLDTNLTLNASKATFIVNHSITLDNLEQNTLYYYKVESYDIFGFNNSSEIGTFTTDLKRSNSGSSNYYYPKKPLGNSDGYGEARIRGPDTDVKYDVDEEATVDVDYTIEVAESRVTSSMWFIPVIAGMLGILFIVIWKRRKDE